MRKTALLFSIVLTLICSSCKTKQPAADTNASTRTEIPPAVPETQPKTFDFHQQTSWLLGYFNPAQLKQTPHSEWYFKGFDEYEFKSEAVNSLLDIPKEGLSIKIVMGTWCPDSRREVPRFMRIMDVWHFPQDKITFIGVDDNKKSPIGDFENLDIQRVPTFIVYKNNIEAGRIIEVPKTSLEQDLVNILTGMNNNK